MQYVYILDYSTPSRITLKVDDNVHLERSEVFEKLLRFYHLKLTECSWMIADKPVDEEEIPGVTTKV